jgi:hypothetical protein
MSGPDQTGTPGTDVETVPRHPLEGTHMPVSYVRVAMAAAQAFGASSMWASAAVICHATRREPTGAAD